MAKKINGRALQIKIDAVTLQRVDNLKQIFRSPKLVTYCDINNPSAELYTNMKVKKASELGITEQIKHINQSTTLAWMEENITTDNQDLDIDGIMMQLPLPKQLRDQTDYLISLIDEAKDVDGLSDKSPFLPATVLGVMLILEDQKLLGQKLNYQVVGGVRGKIGQVLVRVLSEKGEMVGGISKDDPDLPKKARQADVLISSTGVPGIIKPEMIKPGIVAVDVGLGDLDPECYPKTSAYTPKFGGTGPMTVSALMQNVVWAVEMKLP